MNLIHIYALYSQQPSYCLSLLKQKHLTTDSLKQFDTLLRHRKSWKRTFKSCGEYKGPLVARFCKLKAFPRAEDVPEGGRSVGWKALCIVVDIVVGD